MSAPDEIMATADLVAERVAELVLARLLPFRTATLGTLGQVEHAMTELAGNVLDAIAAGPGERGERYDPTIDHHAPPRIGEVTDEGGPR